MATLDVWPQAGRDTVTAMRTLLALIASLHVGLASAEDAYAPGKTIEFSSVAAALKALEARDGNGTIVTHADGWTIVNEPLASAQWSFTPADHPAYPAVVRRVIKRAPDGMVSVEVGSRCEALEAACTQLLAEFAAMNERVTQGVKARARQGSSQTTP
jgi:hypothetical protein